MNFKRETIGSVVESITNGINCKQNKKGVGVKISRIETIADRKIDYQKTGFCKLNENDKKKYKLIKGDILFSHINSPTHVGKTAIYLGEEDLYHGVNLLKIKVKKYISPYYFKYFLDGIFQSGYWKKTSKQSVNQASVNQNDIKKIDFFYPSLEEQRLIVTKIDSLFVEIDRAINLIDDKNREFSKLLSSVLTELLNFSNTEKVKLGEICDVKRGTTITKKDTNNGIVPVIGGGKKPTYFHDKPNRESGCITISGSGASAGYVNMWDTPIFASDCSTVEPRDDLHLKKFLYYYLISQQHFIYENFRSGAAQPHVYAKDLSTLDYPIVSPTKQKLIVEKLDKNFSQIKLAKEILNNKKQNFLKLKSAILIDKLQTTTI